MSPRRLLCPLIYFLIFFHNFSLVWGFIFCSHFFPSFLSYVSNFSYYLILSLSIPLFSFTFWWWPVHGQCHGHYFGPKIFISFSIHIDIETRETSLMSYFCLLCVFDQFSLFSHFSRHFFFMCQNFSLIMSPLCLFL